MKIDRLIGIITTLQQKRNVTVGYLAEKFEVSRRTISRDIETLCRAGIPIVTCQGAGGGISVMEGFSLDTTIFTREELTKIFSGLKSLDSVSYSSAAEKIAAKLGGDSVLKMSDNMVIDLSSYYKGDLAPKLELIKKAINESKCISFHYCYIKGESEKLIEPYLFVFKWSDWYVFGFCKERRDFRIYKLRRLWNLQMTDEMFVPRDIPEEKKEFGFCMGKGYTVTAVYDQSVKYRLVEKYGHKCFVEQEDGSLYTEWTFETESSAVEWFLSFGDKVKVTGPLEMKNKMKAVLDSIKKLYEI